MRSPRVLAVVGSRAEAIRMGPVVRALRSTSSFEVRVLATAERILPDDGGAQDAGIGADVVLRARSRRAGPAARSAFLLDEIDRVLDASSFDVVLAAGDGPAVVAAAMAASLRSTLFGHVDAGARGAGGTGPFPQQVASRVVSALASLHFASTRGALASLLGEGVGADRIVVTGSTGIDALLDAAAGGATLPVDVFPAERLAVVALDSRLPPDPLTEALPGLVREAVAGVEQGRAVWVVAPDAPARVALREGLAGAEVIEPGDWSAFVALLRRADVVVTDSGDLEEAAPCFGAPVISLRPSIDRPEVVAAGLVEPAGCDAGRLQLRLASLLATAPRRLRTVNPHGDGRAALRIADTLSRIFAAGPGAGRGAPG